MSQKYYADVIQLKLDSKHAHERLTEIVRTRLVDCGWRDQVRLACRKLLEQNDQYTCDELIQAVTPDARSMVPGAVKIQLLRELEAILVHNDKQH